MGPRVREVGIERRELRESVRETISAGREKVERRASNTGKSMLQFEGELLQRKYL